MARVLTVAALLVVAAVAFLLPEADPAGLAALQCHELAATRVGPAPPDGVAEDAEDERPTLAELVLDGPAVTTGEDGEPVLVLGGVGLRHRTHPSGDLAVHGLARRSIVRALREAADGRGASLSVDGELTPRPGGAGFLVTVDDDTWTIHYEVPAGTASEAVEVEVTADWSPPSETSVLPPLIAIVLAVLTRRPVVALFAGVWAAAYLVLRAEGSSVASALGEGLPHLWTEWIWPKIAEETYNQQIVGFVFCMLAMVGVMTKSGGIRGLMDLLARYASTVRSTQVATWLMGLVVFFDDYANCILVGTTMRPLTDRFRISREKLAYLVDSTAAPVAGLSIFSTWIAFEVSTFSAQLPAAGLPTSAGYAVFMQTIPYRFYCILSLFLAGWIAFTGRDFGPMLTAERRARTTGQLVRPGSRPMVSDVATSMEPAPGVEPRAHRAVLPVVLFVSLTLFEIFRVGFAAMRAADPSVTLGSVLSIEGVTALLGDGDSTRAILIGSSSGMGLAILLALVAGLRGEILGAITATVRAMGVALLILYLAWAIGDACGVLGTAPYISELASGLVLAEILPIALFLLGAAVAFATGSSWGTMSILLPLTVGLAYTLGTDSGIGGQLLVVMSIGAVLEGSIFGDHCSPLSDTTVLSSTAAASDHIDHVRTQAPYALAVMAVALVLGYLPCTLFGLSPWIALLLGAGALALLVRAVGRFADAPPVPAES